jgi:hypothetical protein
LFREDLSRRTREYRAQDRLKALREIREFKYNEVERYKKG